MTTLPKLDLEFRQLGPHAFRNRCPAKREPALPGHVAAMREAEKVERFRSSFSASLTVPGRAAAKLDQAGLRVVEFQAKFGESRPEFVQTSFRVHFTLETDHESSSPGESHPQALTEPDVNLSAHPALIIQTQDEFRATITQTDAVHVEQHGPTNALRCVDGSAIA